MGRRRVKKFPRMPEGDGDHQKDMRREQESAQKGRLKVHGTPVRTCGLPGLNLLSGTGSRPVTLKPPVYQPAESCVKPEGRCPPRARGSPAQVETLVACEVLEEIRDVGADLPAFVHAGEMCPHVFWFFEVIDLGMMCARHSLIAEYTARYAILVVGAQVSSGKGHLKPLHTCICFLENHINNLHQDSSET